MVLNPAWFNALVDDTGTGTTGTVWNKATIKGLTDNIDAEINRIDYTQNFWTPAITAAGGGTPSYSARTGFYALVQQHLCWVGFSMTFTKGTLSGGLSLAGLPIPAVNASGASFGGIVIPWFTGLAVPVAGLGTVSTANATVMPIVLVAAGGNTTIAYLDSNYFGAGAVELRGAGVYAV